MTHYLLRSQGHETDLTISVTAVRIRQLILELTLVPAVGNVDGLGPPDQTMDRWIFTTTRRRRTPGPRRSIDPVL
jgi:hypothetical protein